MLFANNLFKECKILKISDFINYKYALFVINSLKKENLQIFNDMFTLLDLNHTHNTCATPNHLFALRDKLLTMELTL